MKSTIIMEQHPHLPLMPRSKMQIKNLNEKDAAFVNTTYIGDVGGRYLLIDQPKIQGNPVFNDIGQACFIRFESQGSMLGFQSRVIYVYQNPLNMICLEYPKYLEVINSRSEDRFAVSIPAKVIHHDFPHNQEMEGMITNLTSSGCRMSVNKFIDIGRSLLLSFELENQKVDKLACEVKNIRAYEKGQYELGLHFMDKVEGLAQMTQRLQKSRQNSDDSFNQFFFADFN